MNLRQRNIRGLHRLQGAHVGVEARAARELQFVLDVARQVLVLLHPATQGRILEDERLVAGRQVCDDRIHRHVGDLGDVLQVELALLGQADRVAIGRRLGAVDLLLRVENALLEQRRFLRGGRRRRLPKSLGRCGRDRFRVVAFQAELDARVVVHQRLVGRVVQEPEVIHELVVDAVEFGALGFEDLGGRIRALVGHQVIGHLAQGQHALDAAEPSHAERLLFGPRGLGGEFAELDVTVGVVIDALHDALTLAEVTADGHVLAVQHDRRGSLIGLSGPSLADTLERRPLVLEDAVNLFGEVHARDRLQREFAALAAAAVHRALHRRLAEQHARVLRKIAVQGDGLVVLVEQAPLGVEPGHIVSRHAVALLAAQALQENDVGRHLGARVLREGVIRQAEGADELEVLRQVLARLRVSGVEEAAGHHERHDAARAQVHCRLGDHVVVDLEAGNFGALLVGVGDALVAERRVADGNVHATVGEFSVLEARRRQDLRVGVQVLGDQAGDRVDLGGEPLRACRHIGRHQADEIAGADRGLEESAALDAEVSQYPVHRPDDLGRGVVRVEHRLPHPEQLVRRQDALEFGVGLALLLRRGVVALENVLQAAPSDVLCERRLLFAGRVAVLALEFEHKAHRSQVCADSLTGRAGAERVRAGDGVVARVIAEARRELRFRLRGRRVVLDRLGHILQRSWLAGDLNLLYAVAIGSFRQNRSRLSCQASVAPIPCVFCSTLISISVRSAQAAASFSSRPSAFKVL